MATKDSTSSIQLDSPLQIGAALATDTLERRSFAVRISHVLERITPDSGLVVSVEGAWGCGKTSVLAMVEELLSDEPDVSRPVVVHFNPWLVGDRDALLRQFLASIAKAVKLSDHTKDGKRVAKELKTYAKAFDVLKLIPGAEPWASIVKSVVESVGSASEAAFEYKTPDIEARKQDLERALRKFPQRIVVLIDDLDRLYPAEVYEMVRIIKAVGDLPNVGYVLAWDEKFVSAALDKLNVPFASAYLDKVVQVRLPVPPLSFVQRVAQMNEGVVRLPAEARESYFHNSEGRMGTVFHHGLCELLEHPRDVVRLFDVVASIEHGLRGEIHLADMIGLAALMTKAPPVFSLLRSTPQAFVGRRPGRPFMMEKAQDVINEFSEELDDAIALCHNSRCVRELVHCLFPLTVNKEKKFGFDRAVFTEGHLGHPDRLSVALQMSTGQVDVSLVLVRRFLFHQAERASIAAVLNERNCTAFLDYLASTVETLGHDVQLDSEPLCIALARLIETQAFLNHERGRTDVFLMSAERLAHRAIGAVCRRMEPEAAAALCEVLICDGDALSIAAIVAMESYVNEEKNGVDDGSAVRASSDSKERVLGVFGQNLKDAAATGSLFNKVCFARIVSFASRLVPGRCKSVFEAMQTQDPTLDHFVLAMMEGGFDSFKGQIYEVPKEVERVEKFVSMSLLRTLAARRLEDAALTFPARSAWKAVAEGKAFYGIDGSTAMR